MDTGQENPEGKSRNRRSENSCQHGYGYFKEYCDSTSIHGLKYLAEERSLGERILWMTLITTALSACAYLISQIYTKYTESPVIVTFATKESPIYTIPFPAVTICPMTKARKYLFNYTDTYYKLNGSKSLSESEERYARYMSVICDVEDNFFPNDTYFTDDVFKGLHEIKVPFDLTFDSCIFMTDDIECEDLFVPIIVDQGLCFTFNMLDRSDIFNPNVVHFSDYHQTSPSEWSVENGYTKRKEQKMDFPFRAFLAGADNSLQVILIHNSSDLDYLCPVDVQGFSVTLHAPYSVPQLKKQFFMVPLDRVVNAVVQPRVMATSEKVKMFKPKSRECYFSTEKHLKYFKIYSPKNCKLECLTNFTLKHCGCVSFHMPRENSTPICGTAKQMCGREAELLLKLQQYEIQIEDEGMDFFCDCKPLCTDLTYEVEQSQSPWNPREQFKALKIEKLIDDRIHFTKLSIFFKQDSFLTSERNELYGPTDFLANFGGLLGLFTGFSLLSAAEILYFLSVRLCCNFRLFRRWTGPQEENAALT